VFSLHKLSAVSRMMSSLDFCSFGTSSEVNIAEFIIEPLAVTHLEARKESFTVGEGRFYEFFTRKL
jgi:hypothetical protein